MMFWMSGVVLVAAVLLGGGSRAGFIGDVWVQVVAIPLLLAGIWSLAERHAHGAAWRDTPDSPLFAGLALLLAWPVLQLVPLPTLFGGGPATAQMLGAASGGGWHGVSLAPAASWAAIASALPPAATFLAVSQLDAPARFRLTALVIGLGTVSLLLGFMQIVQGPESGLRFFAFTNPAEAVGFFANRNHFAAQLYTTLVLAAVWFVFAARNFARLGTMDTRAILWFSLASVLLIASVAGLALARSRAGLLIAVMAIAGIIVMVYMEQGSGAGATGEQRSSSRSPLVRRLTVFALVGAVLFAAQFGLDRMATRFENDPLEDLRIPLTQVTLSTAFASLPFGTGLGSFVPVYASQERTGDLLGAYANRAHNDWAEFWLETGLPGMVIAALFLWWLIRRSGPVWRSEVADDVEQHQMLQRGAFLAIVLLLAHSLVDYPLRTTAMATLFAFAVAILVEPGDARMPVHAAPKPPPRKRSKRRHTVAEPPRDTWGADMAWPEEWQKQDIPVIKKRPE